MRNTIFLLCLLLSTTAFAQKTGDDNPAKTTQVRREIYEKVSIQLPTPVTAEAARTALLARKPVVLNLGCDLHLRDDISSPYARHLYFEQTYAGTPIYQTGIKATINNTGRIISLLNNLKEFSGTPQGFGRSEQDVAALLPAMLDEGFPDFKIIESIHQYFLQNGQLIPTHKVVYTSNTFSWELLLADTDLSELLRTDLAAYRLDPMALDTPGTALVFDPDPLTSSGIVYGCPYCDNNDADTPELNAQRVSVTLKDLTFNAGRFILEGPYVKVQSREKPDDTVVTTTNGNFSFTRNQQGFEDVMVYYHIDSMQRYVQSLGFFNLYNFPVIADAHGLNGADNSHFVRAGVDSRVAFGEGWVDDAEDVDVIVHEYGHALSHSGSPNSNSGQERQGLDEGIGDYQAASYSRGHSYTFWKNTFTWDGHNEFWPGRSASDPTLYPPSNTSIYTYGSIWASTLMEVYGQIGKEASDKVFYQSLYGNTTDMTLTDAARVVIDADSLVYGGAHHDAYQLAFCSRGIFTGAMPGMDCSLGTQESKDAILDWKLFPNPAQNKVQIEVNPTNLSLKLTYAIFDMLGREAIKGEIQTPNTSLDITTLQSGIYLIQLTTKEGRKDTQKLVIE